MALGSRLPAGRVGPETYITPFAIGRPEIGVDCLVAFRAVINDTKDGRSYQVPVEGHHANSLIGKKTGDTIDGIFVGLPGYKLQITGGSDKDGFPMRRDLPGPRRKKLLVAKSIGFNSKKNGLRMRKNFRGNTVCPDTVQINMKVTQHGMKSVSDILKSEEKTQE
jgi:small subunit ribosomal protein S6e